MRRVGSNTLSGSVTRASPLAGGEKGAPVIAVLRFSIVVDERKDCLMDRYTMLNIQNCRLLFPGRNVTPAATGHEPVFQFAAMHPAVSQRGQRDGCTLDRSHPALEIDHPPDAVRSTEYRVL